jgi:hypothetical protein
MGLFDDLFKNEGSQKPKSANPLNIIDNPQLNRMHQLPDLVDEFAKDLLLYLSKMADKQEYISASQTISLVVYYSIDLLIEYKNKSLDTLPSSVVEEVKKQVLKAAQKTFETFNRDYIIENLLSQVDTKIWEVDIISETQNYMRRILS